jgi:photosystem II stability/assembly factor-like uncharacterized protein
MFHYNDPIAEERENKELVKQLQELHSTQKQDKQDLATIQALLQQANNQSLPFTPHQGAVTNGASTRGNLSMLKRSDIAVGNKSHWSRRFSVLAAALIVMLLTGALVSMLAQSHNNATGTNARQFTPSNQFQMVSETSGWAVGNVEDNTSTNTNHKIVAHTSDGGQSWQNVTPPSLVGKLLSGIEYMVQPLNATTAWLYKNTFQSSVLAPDNTPVAAISDMSLYFTTNGGVTWQQALPETSEGKILLEELTFIDANNGWAVASLQHITEVSSPSDIPSEIVRTKDGGRTWTKIYGSSKLERISSLTFTDESNGWMITTATEDKKPQYLTSTFNRTFDGGKHWKAVTLPELPPGARALSYDAPRFSNENDGILVVANESEPEYGYSTVAYITHDGGATWSISKPIPVVGILSATDANHLWIMGTAPQTGMLATPTAASHTTQVPVQDVNKPKTIYATSDGGQHWTQISIQPQWYYVQTVNFVSNTTGWVTTSIENEKGYPIHLYKTTDGGKTWQEVG